MSSSSKQLRLARRSAELAHAVPQVMATRMNRMMFSGPLPSSRDQQEFYRMGTEKFEAFGEAWLAMAWQTTQVQQQFSLWWMQTWWKVALGGWMNPPSLGSLSTGASRNLVNGLLDVTMRGMAPLHSRAVANAQRLGRPAG